MQLITGWQQILKKAWSVKLIAIAGILSGLELLLPMYGPDLPRQWYAIATLLITALALVARLVAQKEFNNEAAE